MSWHKKVAWTEGMFIRPQHFQQQDRYFEKLINLKTTALSGYAWGITSLSLDDGALKIGKVLVRECSGIFEDGTPFDMPGTDSLPDALDVSELQDGDRINLCLPLWKNGSVDMDRPQRTASNARFRIETQQFTDVVADTNSLADIDVAHKKIQLKSERLTHQQNTVIPIAQVHSVAGDEIRLDKRFIPPALFVVSDANLQGYVREITGLLSLRSQLYSQRILNAGTEAAADISDLLLLQITNRYKALFEHFGRLGRLHPLEIYEQGLSLAAELATFTSETRSLTELLGYNHQDLKGCFDELMLELNRSLNTLLEQNAYRIELEVKSYGVRIGMIPGEELSERSYVLVVSSDLPKEALRSKFPTHLKIGPVEHITQLVNRQLPGIRIEPMPVAPRQIPYYGGAVYFELQAQGRLWEAIRTNRAIALHIGEQFPDLKMDLWAIKQ
ncbi:type VI secretion system baseplate subunit TssK [Nitrincola iocasae]|uniref:Type VI secretion system baseplate subunit TssK n=1 Tax=Nitrincola iocasae TaxID=2614693 RepID=A0A5J6LBM2_9GAMM|nr:type VI secretion system baseplate subunit TssK [Nitrincola iocasae]QEW05701.1 type VI secretion system baseplate subunit TssK [Nitrincola iocasae]